MGITVMTQKKDDEQIRQQFYIRQSRQMIALAIALFIVLLAAALHKRPLFGELSKDTLIGMQIAAIAAFLGFTAVNWKCPSCSKSLGSNINKQVCGKCGARLR